MVSKFERNFFVPQVYETFTSLNRETCEDEKFVIQDLPENLIEEASEFMIEYYARDETFQNAIKVSVGELKNFYRFVFQQKTAIACFTVKTRELVGINALSVKTKGIDSSFEVTFGALWSLINVLCLQSDDKVFKRMRESFAFINKFYDVHDHNNVLDFLYDHGLAVKTEFRGRGIATALLKARVAFMKAHELTVTASILSTLASQKAALKLGYQENFSINYSTLQERFEDFDFSSANCDDCKILSLKIQ